MKTLCIRPASLLQAVVLYVALLALTATFNLQPSTCHAQAQPSSPLFSGLASALDVNDTNSLIHANEINVTPQFKWSATDEKAGGALCVDWWVTDQQGAFFGFEEYSTRASYFSLGYQARTVFQGMEVSLGLGTRQSNDDPIGDVKMFIRPTLTKKIYGNENWDIRLAIGCDVMNQGKPNPFLGVTFRALKF